MHKLEITPPHSIELERFLLGFLINEASKYYDIEKYLSADLFYNNNHKTIFLTIYNLIQENTEVNLLSTSQNISEKETGISPFFLTQLAGEYNFTIDYQRHVFKLFELSVNRKLITTLESCLELTVEGKNDIFGVIEDLKSKVTEISFQNKQDFFSLKEVVNSIMDGIIERQNSNNDFFGIPYGFTEIDKFTKGRQKSDLTIIAAETSQGKTSLALNSALNIAKMGYKIGFISLEMNEQQLISRLMSIETKIKSNRMLNDKLNNQELKQIENNINELLKCQIFIDNAKSSDLENIIASIKLMKMKFNIDLFVIDYIQLMKCKKGFNREQEIATIARTLKNTAKEIDTPIDALSQLRRNNDNPQPKISRLRESGQIEEAADSIFLIWRPEHYNKNYTFIDKTKDYSMHNTEGKAQILLEKGRNCGTNDWILGFEKEFTHFYELNEYFNDEIQPNQQFNNPF